MSKKLAAKNALIEMPQFARPAVEAGPAVPAQPRPRTAVGGMAQFVTTQSPIHREAEALREIVKSYEGAKVVRAVNPTEIAPSEWANRHPDTFENTDFAELKREIKDAGGNVQPIKIRPLNRSTQSAADGQHPRFEIIYGHRRHRACLELGLPVHALIEEVDDQKLFEQMERENRGRKNLSAWEQGRMYALALEKGLYVSQRKLSEAIGVDVSLVSKSLALAKLPDAVLRAFQSPLDVQFRWAQPLGEALQKNPDGVLAVARLLAALPAEARPAPAAVLAQLTASAQAPRIHGELTVLRRQGKKIGHFSTDAKGVLTLKLHTGDLNAAKREELATTLMAFLTAS